MKNIKDNHTPNDMFYAEPRGTEYEKVMKEKALPDKYKWCK